MKKLIIVLSLISFGIVATGQSFLRNVSSDMFKDGTLTRGKNSVILPRPVVHANGIQMYFDGSKRLVSAIGMGISMAHFVPKETGEPYQDFAITAMLLLGGDVLAQTLSDGSEPDKTEFSFQLSVTGWEYLSVGYGYNFTLKKGFIGIGMSYSFN